MLEPWIIEQIRRREQEERRRHERPQLEIPSSDGSPEHWRRQDDDPDRNDKDRNNGNPPPRDPDDRDKPDDNPSERGVMIIDFGLG
jgi:hypothetical protein